jgi:hypothetical protein
VFDSLEQAPAIVSWLPTSSATIAISGVPFVARNTEPVRRKMLRCAAMVACAL